MELDPVVDQIHVLNAADTIVATTDPIVLSDGRRAPAMVTHLDGTLVSESRPGRAGEELVMSLVGLGRTIPLLKTGEATPTPPPTLERQPLLIYDYHPNAAPSRQLAERSAAPGLSPLFVGPTPGRVGMYQVNFRVPPPPPGITPNCGGRVQSNLTVTVVGYSFDGAAICVEGSFHLHGSSSPLSGSPQASQ